MSRDNFKFIICTFHTDEIYLLTIIVLQAILDEGEDPDEFLIIPSGGSNKISPRKNSGN